MLWRQKIECSPQYLTGLLQVFHLQENVSILKLADYWLFYHRSLIIAYWWLVADEWWLILENHLKGKAPSTGRWPPTVVQNLKKGKIEYQSIFQWKYLCHCIASRSIVMYSKIFRNFSGFDLGQDLDVWDVLFPGRGRPHLVKTKYMISVIDIGFCVLVYMWYNRVYNNKAIG